MSHERVKELRQIKEQFKRNIISLGLDELTTSPLISLIAKFNVSLHEKYTASNFTEMVKDNYMSGHEGLKKGLNRLSMYGFELLKPERERASGWRSISVPDIIIRIKGSLTVLTSLGYRARAANDFVFPDASQPNVTMVTEITMELIIGQLELELEPDRVKQFVLDNYVVSRPLVDTFESENIAVLSERSQRTSATPGHSGLQSTVSTLSAGGSSFQSGNNTVQCDICGDMTATVTCDQCDNKILCPSCDLKWHQHVKRKDHIRRTLSVSFTAFQGTRENDTSSSSFSTLPKMPGNDTRIPGDVMPNYPSSSTVSTIRRNDIMMNNDTKSNSTFSKMLGNDTRIPNDAISNSSSSSTLPTTRRNDIMMNNDTNSNSTFPRMLGKDIRVPPVATISKYPLSSTLPTKTSGSDTMITSDTKYNSTFPTTLGNDIRVHEDIISNYSSSSALPTTRRKDIMLTNDTKPNSTLLKTPESDIRVPRDVLPCYSASSTASATRWNDVATTGNAKPSTLENDNRIKDGVISNSLPHSSVALEKYKLLKFQLSENASPLAYATSSWDTSSNGDDLTVLLSQIKKPPVSTAAFISNFSQISPQSYEEDPWKKNTGTTHSPKLPQDSKSKTSSGSNLLDLEIHALLFEATEPNGELKYEFERRNDSQGNLYLHQQSSFMKSLQGLCSEPSLSSGQVMSQGPGLSGSSKPMNEALEVIQKQIDQSELFNSSKALVRAFRNAEDKGLSQDELKTILSLSPNLSDSITYMNEVWPKKVSDVIRQSRDRVQYDVSCNPESLARTCLSEGRGEVGGAVELFVAAWENKLESIMMTCALSSSEDRSLVASELSRCHGDDDEVLTVLIKQKFLGRIYTNHINELNNVADESKSHLNEELARILKDDLQDKERRVRIILCEANLQGWQRSENVITLLNEMNEAQLVDVVEAVRSQGNLERCREFLRRECECVICYSMYPLMQMRSLPACQCRVCLDCLKGHFEVVIRERYVRNLVCPACGLPDIDNSEQTEAYFDILLIMFRNVLSDDVCELFQEKLRDWNLMMDPGFRWCAHANCRFGFIVDPELAHRKKVVCPSCRKAMCKHCKKVWEIQHADLSCEDFQAWKEANDPELQAMGLARHLEECGIECPHCKCRYSLAKGGCMHFTCIQCRHEFCSGCMQDFKRGKKCQKFESCVRAGLHCHHPRDCLFYLRDRDIKELQKLLSASIQMFYLRDRDIEELQKLLSDHNVTYDVEVNKEMAAAGNVCNVMEQKQTQTGFQDEPCGKALTQYSAELCDVHYCEYLVGLINRNGIDPAEVMVERELSLLLEKEEKQVPRQRRQEKADDYRLRLLQCVVKELPLPPRTRRPMTSPRPVNAMATDASTLALDE